MSVRRLFPLVTLAIALGGPLAAGAQTAPPAPPPDAPATAGSPQPGAPHRHRHHRSMIHALNSVHLSDAQKQQIATFRAQEKQANLNADSATKRANGAKMRQQIIGILSPDQKAQLHSAMHAHPAGGAMPPGSEPMPNPAPSP